MSAKHPLPRWAILYLAMPLAGALFWLIQRLHPSGITRDLLMVGALLIVGGYVEAWHLANTVRLLHHPLTDRPGAPIYYVREATGAGPTPAASGVRAVLVTGSYHDLFAMPVYIAEPMPSSTAARGLEETA